MKPNFALNLSHDGIGLLHRKKGSKNGWTLIGEVAFSDPEMAQNLDMLRKTAADLEKGGLATKLLIPNSEILYTEIDAPGPDDIQREVQIREGLEGATPYNVSELVFDWRKVGGTKVKVAVLARETLNEAEAFAKEHRLNPVSFVARPSAQGFNGEAFFGKAAGAAALLGPGEQVERDNGPVPKLETLRPKTPEPPKASPAPDSPAEPAKPEPKKVEAKGSDTPVVAPKPEAQSAPAPKAEPTENAAPAAPPKSQAKPAAPTPEPAKEAPVEAKQSQPIPAKSEAVLTRAETDHAAEDARIAALLADVEEPSDPLKPITKTVPAPEAQSKQTQPKQAPAKRTPAKAQASAPVLAPFPPTPETADDEGDGRLPPPPPVRRKMPDGIKQPVQPASGAQASPTAQSARPPIPKKRVTPAIPAAASPSTKPTPVPPRAAAFMSSRTAPSNAGVVSPTTPAKPPAIPQKAAEVPPKPVAAKAPPKPNGLAKSAPVKPRTTPASQPTKTPSITSPTLAGEDRTASNTGTGTKQNEKKSGTSLMDRAGKGAQGLLSRTKSASAGFASRRAKSAEDKEKSKKAAPVSKATKGASTLIAPLPKGKSAPAKPAKTIPKTTIKPLVGAPKTQSDDVQSEADRMTMFGARKSQKREIGGKHKYLGLILTLVLLLVMAIVAMSSVFFFSDENGFFNRGVPDENPFAIAAVPDATLTTPPIEASPDLTSPTEHPPPGASTDASTLQTPGDLTGSEDISIASVLPNNFEPETIDETPPAAQDLPDAVPATLPPRTSSPQVLTEDAAEAQYAVSGVWQKAPAAPAEPAGSRIDDLYVASIDPRVSSQDAVALPSKVARSQEARPASPLPPPAAGTSFALDTRGLVTPTPEGTLSPDGVLIFSGRPEFVAPARPGRVVPEITPPSFLQELRPKPRPEGLVEDNERANLGGITRIEMAALRPTARPASLQAEANAASDGAPNELAVIASPSPGHRPANFGTIVTAALARAATTTASDGSSLSAPSSSGPIIPTRASVARQATIDNAIRLREINLIGVFGSASTRRALVRLKSGSYVKVSVGDRLNGGQVLSITETRLVYKKNSRTHTLDMLPLG